jgi:hypothetical protein
MQSALVTTAWHSTTRDWNPLKVLIRPTGYWCFQNFILLKYDRFLYLITYFIYLYYIEFKIKVFMEVYFIGFWWSAFRLSLYIYFFFWKIKQFIDTIVNCFETFRANYVVRAGGWKSVFDVTFNLLSELFFRISVVYFFATLDKSIIFFLELRIPLFLLRFVISRLDWGSSVGIATRYGQDGPDIESYLGEGEIFYTRSDRPWGPPSLLYNGYRVSFPGVKRPGRGGNHPPQSSAEVKERIELYLYSPFGPSWPVVGRALPLPYSYGEYVIVKVFNTYFFFVLRNLFDCV